jgi:hypothetical protein
MNIDIRYGVGGASLWHVSADPGQSWRLKISRIQDASMAFENIDGTGEGQAPISPDPGTYWFFLNTSAGIPVTNISYTVAAPIPTPLPPPPVFPPKPGEPIVLPPKEEVVGTIGTRCDMINNYSFARSVYSYRDRYTDRRGGMSMDPENTRGTASRDPGCFLPTPPTAKDWQDGIQKQVTAGFDALSKYVTDGLKSVTESWQNGILDMETRLKAWIQKMILELLLTKLMEGRKNGNS